MNKLQQALDCWNVAAVECGWPVVKFPTSEDRERKLYRLLRKFGMEGFREVLAKAEASDFLRGMTARSERHEGWRFTFDCIVRESFFVKIRDGNYDNREAAAPTFKSPETLLWEARLRSHKPGDRWLGIWGPAPGEDGCQAPKGLVEDWQQRHLH